MKLFDFFKPEERAAKKDPKDKSLVIPFDINCWNYKHFDGDLLKMEIICACIDALARNLAKMELTAVMRKKDSMAVTTTTSEVYRVLQHPNPYMTMYDFIYKVAALYYASNNAFIWPEYDELGSLVAIWPVNYSRFKLMTYNGVLVARFEMHHNHFYTVPYDELVPLRNHFFQDDILGDDNTPFNPVADLMKAQNEGIIEGIKSSAIIRGILKAVQVMKEEDLKAAKEEFIQENLQIKNNGGVLMVDSKFDYKALDSKPYVIDADTRKQTEEMAFQYFGVNREFLENSFTAEKYESVYEGRLEPFAIMLCQALTAHLFTARELGFGNRIEANLSKLKYQPLNTVTNVINATKELGLFTRDEYREMLGYEPLGPDRGGDEIMIATNNYTSTQQEGEADGTN